MKLNQIVQAVQQYRSINNARPKTLNLSVVDADAIFGEMLANRSIAPNIEQKAITAHMEGGQAIIDFMTTHEIMGMKVKFFDVVS